MKFEGVSDRKRAGRAVSAVAALVGTSMALAPAAFAAPGSTQLASKGMGGTFINADAKEPSISADGRYVTFASAASNIVAGDTNSLVDIFVTDRQTGETVLVSQGTDGAIGNGDSSQPSISPDGRYVAFVSNATNFVPENNPVVNGTEVNARDIFLRDLQAHTTTRITLGGGNPGKVGASFDPSVSTNADYVAFTSLDRAIGGFGDCNDVHDVFLWEKATNTVTMIPVGDVPSVCGTAPNTYDGQKLGNRESQNPAVSHDGRFVAYSSDAYNLDSTHPDSHKYDLPAPVLTPGHPPLGTNIFLWDRTTGKSVRIDNGPGGAEPNGDAGFVPAISGDGKVIAYMSDATNLVTGDTNTVRDTFTYNTQTGATTRVTVNAAGQEQKCPNVADQTACQSYEGPALNNDGSIVAFISGATNLVQPDSNVTGRDVYLRDMGSGAITRADVSDNGSQANAGTIGSSPALSIDGRFVAYPSKGTNLVAGDVTSNPQAADIFVSDRNPGAATGWSGASIWTTACTVNCGDGGGGGGGGGGTSGSGYWMVATDGGIFSYGSAKFFGSTGAIRLNKPIVGMSTTPGRQGYWLVASDGGIFSYGDAKFHGSTGNIVLNKPIVGMTTTPSGNGYWMVATDGGIFAFGDAKFFGSTGNIRLNKPIVGMTSTPDGGGYWLVASDGGIFAFGNAKFQGSTGNITLAKPITAMTSTKSGNGYWMTATDGGIFAFGDATFFGSTGGQTLPRPIVAMSTSPSGNGYLMAGADGSVYNFGDANKIGELRGQPLAKPIVGMTSF